MDPQVITELDDGWKRAEFRVIGDGSSIESARRPALPLGVSQFCVVGDFGITMLVEYATPA